MNPLWISFVCLSINADTCKKNLYIGKHRMWFIRIIVWRPHRIQILIYQLTFIFRQFMNVFCLRCATSHILIYLCPRALAPFGSFLLYIFLKKINSLRVSRYGETLRGKQSGYNSNDKEHFNCMLIAACSLIIVVISTKSFLSNTVIIDQI